MRLMGDSEAGDAARLTRQLRLILALRCLRTACLAQPVMVVWFEEVSRLQPPESSTAPP
jgi:hypothetical protein